MTSFARAALTGALLASSFCLPAAAQQLISDEQIGKTLAQVHCGKKEMGSAVRYLNQMRVPASKLTNADQYPGVMRGYHREAGWSGC
jgi:hypothetical protein